MLAIDWILLANNWEFGRIMDIFVLLPLKEICPYWSHPLTKEPIDHLINNLKGKNNNITKLSQSDIINYVE